MNINRQTGSSETVTVQILYAEDSRVDALLTQAMLAKMQPWRAEVTHTMSLQETISALQTSSYDLLLLDLSLPDSNSVVTVKSVQEHVQNIPIIVLTGDDEAHTITEIMRLGVQDYLVKGRIDTDRLTRSIRYAVNNKLAELENEQYQAQLIEAQRLEAIGRLAAGLAHDINTPAQFVTCNLRYVRKACLKLNDQVAQLCSVIASNQQEDMGNFIKNTLNDHGIDGLFKEIDTALEESLDGVNRIDRIIKSINQYVHPSNRDLKLTNINDEIDNIITVTRNEWKNTAELITEYDMNIPELECYPDLLNQAFLNMVINASQAIAEKNRLNDKHEKGSIKISTALEGQSVKICITDNGNGIPKEHHSSIFEPFFTTKGVGCGTGQGLSQAYRAVVQVHKGHIKVESELGEGASFTMNIPTNLSELYSETKPNDNGDNVSKG